MVSTVLPVVVIPSTWSLSLGKPSASDAIGEVKGVQWSVENTQKHKAAQVRAEQWKFR